VARPWEDALLADVEAAAVHASWQGRWSSLAASREGGTCCMHLAVCAEPFLSYMLGGSKIVESRFSRRPCAPYRRVSPGDALLLKRVAGPIVGICEITHVSFYEIDTAVLAEIRREFAAAMRAEEPDFWAARESTAYATLMRVGRVERLPPIPCGKTDRRGWVVLGRPGAGPSSQLSTVSCPLKT
jgi:hypothetical protein